MAYIKVGERYFRLASRKSRFLTFLMYLVGYLCAAVGAFIGTMLFSIAAWIFWVIVVIISFIFGTPWAKSLETFSESPTSTLIPLSMYVLILVVLGEVLGYTWSAYNQVIRLKDSKPCGFKENFIRRLTLFIQPLDIFWMFWKDRQRLGDKLAGTVVVKVDVSETEDSEKVDASETANSKGSSTKSVKRAYEASSKNIFAFWRKRIWKERMMKISKKTEILEIAIHKMKNRLSTAEKKLDAAISVEKQFQSTHEKIIAEAEQCYKNAAETLRTGREGPARKLLEKRNEFRRLARQGKKQWEEQKRVAGALSNFLEYLKQKMMVVEAKKAGIDAQYINVATAAELRNTLQTLENNPLVKMEQDADAAVILTKVETETDLEYQEAEFERKYDDHTKEESIENELEKLKAKLQ